MTVASTQNRKTFAGDDATTSFATTPIVFFETSDLQVYVTTDATGVSTLLVEGTGYTVSGGDESAGAVGTVDTSGGSSPHGALLSGTTLVILRELPLTQSADFINNDESDADVAEAALDKLVMSLQRVDERLDRVFALPDGDISGASTELPIPAASKLIGWDDTGLALVNYAAGEISAAISVTAYAETLLGEADADAFFQNLVDGATAETAPAVGDVILLSDVSLTPDDGRKMTLANMLAVVKGLTADATPDRAGDYLLTYDSDAGAAKKVLLSVAVPIATQAEQETGSDTSRAVSPGRQHFHPSAAKAWAQFTDAGTAALQASYNVSSIDDDGTGDYGINFTTAMSSVNYAAAGMSASAVNSVVMMTSNLAASLEIDIKNHDATSVDPAWAAVVVLGDFA